MTTPADIREAGTTMNTTTLPLSSAAYTSERFDRIFDAFRHDAPEGFTFYVTRGEGSMTVHTNNATYARRIIAVMEAAA